ncbi:lipocalin family protein [Flavobacterium sp. ACN6]|uniref:lipocalin family protein n=1 Tax=Flavobacterium sp. ACN6 TaxID=1920426 RepID=UPI000BB2EBB6|nr:lipocalin family protein [Flavobacterium sp. ACN6]PBJ13347.1 hypothetical protein BSF42_17470 [Flavobacterium sp. ACN6]
MKKLSILFVSVLTLGLAVTSCSSDKDDSSASIEGKWEITHMGAVIGTEEVLQPYTNEGGCANDIVEFKADNKFVDTYAEYSDSKCNTFTEEGTFTKDGNTLTKKYIGESEKYEIAELSGSKLKLKMTYSEGGISVSAVVVYKKI